MRKSDVKITPKGPGESSDIQSTDLFPPVYKSPASTPLTATIGPNGNTELKIELKK